MSNTCAKPSPVYIENPSCSISFKSGREFERSENWDATTNYLVLHGPPDEVKVESPQRRLRPRVKGRFCGAEDLLEVAVGGVGVPGVLFSGVVRFHSL